MSYKLELCPRCKEYPQTILSGGWMIACPGCTRKTRRYASAQEAIDKWNHRVNPRARKASHDRP